MRKLLIGLGVLVVVLIAADRVAAVLAARAVAERVQSDFGLADRPAVTAHGIPFLTQVARGKYSDVQVRADGLHTGALARVSVNVRFRGVHAGLADIVRQQISSVPVDQVAGSLTIPYDVVAAVSEIPGLSITPTADGLTLRGTVSALGQSITASVSGRVTLVDGDIVITPGSVAGAGSALPPQVASALASRFSIRIPAGSLPLGLTVDDVRAGSHGLSVTAHVDQVVLHTDGSVSSRLNK